MIIDVKNLKSRVESVTDLLDDYCQRCPGNGQHDCFKCLVRGAMLEAQSMRLYLELTMQQSSQKGVDSSPASRGGKNDRKSDSSGS